MGLTNKLMAFGAICMYIASWYNLGCTAMPPVSSMGNQVMLDIPENGKFIVYILTYGNMYDELGK